MPPTTGYEFGDVVRYIRANRSRRQSAFAIPASIVGLHRGALAALLLRIQDEPSDPPVTDDMHTPPPHVLALMPDSHPLVSRPA